MATFVFAAVTHGGLDSAVEAFVFAGSPRAFGARVLSGRLTDPAAPGEFAATESWLDVAAADIGDEFEVVAITQDQADELGFDVPGPAGPTVPATLVGVIGGPIELENEMPLALFGSGLLDAGDVGVASSVGVLALEPGATVVDLRAQLDARPGGDAFGLGTTEWVSADVRTAVRAQGRGLAVVALIVAVAAFAVLGQLLSRQVRPSVAQRVALRAIGLTRPQLVADPVCSTAIPIAAGCVGAAVLAVVASGIFPVGFASRIEPGPGIRFDPMVHLVAPIIFGVVLVAWVFVVVALGERAPRVPGRPGPLFGSSVDRVVDNPTRFGSNFDFATGAGGDAARRQAAHRRRTGRDGRAPRSAVDDREPGSSPQHTVDRRRLAVGARDPEHGPPGDHVGAPAQPRPGDDAGARSGTAMGVARGALAGDRPRADGLRPRHPARDRGRSRRRSALHRPHRRQDRRERDRVSRSCRPDST